MAHWGMTIDLRKCLGCRACTVVCKQTNQVPRNAWRQVVDGGISECADRQRMFLPMSCMHCSEPPCLEVCPTTATYRRADGIVDIHDDLCIGCGYCIVACPYMARTIIEHNNRFEFELDAIWQEPNGTDPEINHIGICTKCNFCLPRVEAGLAQGLTPGLDSEASPACTVSCSAKALHFGDLNDPNSLVSQLIRENNAVRLLEEVGTDPSVYYIVEQSPSEAYEATKMNFVQPTQQKAWGWPAIANFFLGGIATGFYLLSFLLILLQGGVTDISQPMMFKLLAPMLAGIGFLALTIEAGRPMRARHLLRHLSHSWMSRETLAGAIFIPAALLDWLFPHPFLRGLALVGGLGLLISQGFMVYRARGVTAWNVPMIPLFFLTSGFTTGSGLILLTGLGRLAPIFSSLVIGLICVILNLVMWLLYLLRSHDAAFWKATEPLRRPKALIFSVGISHILPALLLAFLLVIPGLDTAVGLRHVLTTLTGLVLIVGGINQKGGIIQKAGYLRGIELRRPKNETQGPKSLADHPAPIINPGILPLSTDFSRGDLPE